MNTIALKTYPVFSLKFVKAYITTMRPYLMFVSGITGLAGLSFSTEITLLKSLMIFQATFLSYGFGQALTDCFQVDTDSISSHYRPLTQGVVNKKHFLIISFIGLIYCISVLTFYNPLNILLGAVAGLGLLTYTYFKRKWWSGPFYNAWIVVVLFLMAYLAGAEKNYFELDNPILIAAILTVFFGYANFVLTGYFKDVEADRATNYKTLPVVHGRKISAVVSDVFGLVASASVFILLLILTFNSFSSKTLTNSLIFAYAGIGISILTQLNLHSVRTDDEAHKAITPCVHSYILLLSSLAVLNKPDWFIPLIVFYFLYLIIMKIRPAKEQI
jgi:geranylgeranylglycerol-phosphate geranylgeranyltransferase